MISKNESFEQVKASTRAGNYLTQAATEHESEYGQAVEDMALINSINEAANRGAGLQEIFELFTRHTVKLFAGFGATVYLVSSDRQYLDVQHFELSSNLLSTVESMLGLKIERLRIPLKEGSLYLKYLEEKKSRIIYDEHSMREFLSELAQGDLEEKIALLPAIVRALGIGSVISVPLVFQGEYVGIIDVASKDKLTNSDLIRLENIARQITLIISRKKMEEQLRCERDFNAKLIESSPALFIAIDNEARTIMMNSTMLKALGYAREEVIGKDFLTTVVAEQSRNKMIEIYKAILDNKQTIVCESRLLTKDKRDLVVEWQAQCARKPDGKIDYYFGVGIDLTERNILQEQLILSDKLASMGELVSGIAHELNNPLTGVIGFSELLIEKNIPEDLREDVAIIHHEAQRAAEVVNNMLAFARKHTSCRQNSNVNSVLARVLSLRAYEHKVNNIKVITHFSHNLPDVLADIFQLQQVFLNIIINAEYFMKQARNGGVLTVTTEKIGEKVIVNIGDNGPGINPENINKIFDPFFTTKEVGVGTGLGLSMAHGIIKEHGGLIYARSKYQEGATFVVELPAQACCKTESSDDSVLTISGGVE